MRAAGVEVLRKVLGLASDLAGGEGSDGRVWIGHLARYP